MASAAELAILLKASGVSRTSDDLKGVGHAAQGMGSTVASAAKAAAAGLAILSAASVGLGIFAVKAASDMSEAQNKVSVVFGDSSGAIEEFAKGAAQNLGLSRSEALSAAGTFGNLFVAMKIGQPEAARMSEGILTLASDLASFNNISTTDALEKLRAGLVGETEPLRALGVNLTAASVETQALAMGFRKVGGELPAAAKAQAAYALIMQQTTTAQGDFKNTATGMANAMRIIQASFGDISAEIGGKLLPLVAPLISDFAQALPRAMDAARPVLDAFGTGIGIIAGAVKALATGQGFDVLYTQLNKVFGGDIGAKIASLIDPLARLGREGLAPLKELGGTVLSMMAQQLPLIAAKLGEWGKAFVEWVAPMIPPLLVELGAAAAQVWAWLVEQAPVLAAQLGEWGRAFVEWVGPMIPPLLVELGTMIGQLWAWIRAEGPGLMRTFLSEWVPAAIGWVAQAAVELLPQLALLLVGLSHWIGTVAVPEILKAAAEMGMAIVQGIWAGLEKLDGWLKDRFRDFVTGALDAAKSALGISSPSKAFEEIGENIGEGLIAGIEGAVPEVTATVLELTDGMRAAFADFQRELAAEQQGLSRTWLDNLRHDSQESVRIATEAMQAMVAEGRRAAQLVGNQEDAATRERDSRIAGMLRERQAQADQIALEGELRQYFAGSVTGDLQGAIRQGMTGTGPIGKQLAALLASMADYGMGGGAIGEFARGGIVPGPIGAPMLAIVHGGETVTPAGGSVTVHVDMRGAIISSQADAESWVAQAFTQVFRRGGFPYLAGA